MPKGAGPKWRRGDALSAKKLRAQTLRGVGGVSTSRGGVSQIGGGGAIGIDPPKAIAYRPFILARVTGSAELATNRWKYAWEEAEISGTDFAAKTGGRSGSTGEGFALNGLEAGNDGDGTQGNGVDIDGQIFDDNEDLALVPIGDDAVVLIYMVPNASGGVSPVFFAPNAIDGECA